jgi:hypothetical protein
LAEEPALANEHGTALVGILARAGQYATAIQFASEGPAESRADWVTAAFKIWAGDKPEEALKAFSSFTNQDMRGPIFRAVVDGWADEKASGLADYSLTLPPGEDRAYALTNAMFKWCLQDPASLGAWLNAHSEPVAEFDAGVSALVTHTNGANRSPEVALGWAESISDPAMRFDSIKHVVQEWAAQDPAAAQKYVQNASWLGPDQRRDLLQSIVAKPDIIAGED